MNPGTRIKIIQEIEKLNSTKSKTSYSGAWIALIFSISYLVKLLLNPLKPANENLWFVPAAFFIMLIAVALQSFYIIIQHYTNKKLSLIFEALLENFENKNLNLIEEEIQK